mmetsp:Transcript_76485/g.206652  ORF Transcript_76485/g.206652 Transcript_76485/m.206652 type:complete len:332 (+) Transcript_76485:1322-2317(+)
MRRCRPSGGIGSCVPSSSPWRRPSSAASRPRSARPWLARWRPSRQTLPSRPRRPSRRCGSPRRWTAPCAFASLCRRSWRRRTLGCPPWGRPSVSTSTRARSSWRRSCAPPCCSRSRSLRSWPCSRPRRWRGCRSGRPYRLGRAAAAAPTSARYPRPGRGSCPPRAWWSSARRRAATRRYPASSGVSWWGATCRCSATWPCAPGSSAWSSPALRRPRSSRNCGRGPRRAPWSGWWWTQPAALASRPQAMRTWLQRRRAQRPRPPPGRQSPRRRRRRSSGRSAWRPTRCWTQWPSRTGPRWLAARLRPAASWRSWPRQRASSPRRASGSPSAR